jgi:hypothetical protein
LYPRLADREDLLFMRSRKVAVESVIHPMSALLECCNADILKDDTRRAIARGLLKEAHRVVSRDVPRITYESLEEMLGEHVTKTATNFSPMMNAVMGGRESDIDWINGWIVRRARELGIECPKNEQVIRLIKDKIEAQAILWQERAQAIVAKKRELQIEARKNNRHARYEKIRKEKAVKSTVKLAKAKAMRQEKMSDFHKPQIKTLGNVPIRRVEVSSKMPDFHKPQIEKLGNVAFRRLENSS